MHTTLESRDVPAWPVYTLTVGEDGRVSASGPSIAASWHPTRAAAVGQVAASAAQLGRPVRARATEPDGTEWHLVIFPDGEVAELHGAGPRAKAVRRRQDKRPLTVPADADPPAAPAPRGHGPRPAGAGRNGPPKPETEAETEAGPEAYAETLALIRKHVEAGRVGPAVELAAWLDDQAAHGLGLSHPDALHIRELRAQVTALAGDTAAGVHLYRDVAERWHYRRESEQAETVAARAETLWLQMTDPEKALSTGVAVIRMRNQIPGEGGRALMAALEHQTWLQGGARRQ
jgi:hypothetical protein